MYFLTCDDSGKIEVARMAGRRDWLVGMSYRDRFRAAISYYLGLVQSQVEVFYIPKKAISHPTLARHVPDPPNVLHPPRCPLPTLQTRRPRPLPRKIHPTRQQRPPLAQENPSHMAPQRARQDTRVAALGEAGAGQGHREGVEDDTQGAFCVGAEE